MSRTEGQQNVVDFSHPHSAPHLAGLDSLVFTVSLDLTALDPYEDQNTYTRGEQVGYPNVPKFR